MASLNIENWSANEVAQWIKGLRPEFEAYSNNFLEEEITGKALLTLNVEYLTELSIENANDQNAVLDAVHCLIEVDTCLKGETVHGQVVVVNDQTKALIDKLEKECQEASEGDVKTGVSSMKVAGQVYQLAKKLLSWLIRSPFSEMNACWPLKDSVCRVVRDMTDESLLKNREHLQENLKKLQSSFDQFLNEDSLHEVFKQPPILVNEEFTLDEEGLGIGITTSHHIHTVNSVAAESPAAKNGNIKNGDEIVNVNGQCVIAWPQKNVVTLMKSKPNSVSLVLKKLPPVKGPLNKPVDKPGTPLSEMNVIMDRTKVTSDRPVRVEMKEAGIKEETSLEMQAIENENAEEESSKVEDRIEGIKEEGEADIDGKQEEVENIVSEKESVPEESKKEDDETAAVTDDQSNENEAEGLAEDNENEKPENSPKEMESGEPENDEKVDEMKAEELVKDDDEKAEKKEDAVDEKSPVLEPNETKAEETLKKNEHVAEEGNVAVNGDLKGEVTEQKKDQDGETKVVNGEAEVKTENDSEKVEAKTTEEKSEAKMKTDESKKDIEIKVDSPQKEISTPTVAQNGENDTTPTQEPDASKVSPSKKPARPELPKMKMGSVKNVTVGGASAKQVEVYGTSKVVLREKRKIDGAPNKRISCIELGEADCEGWLTKRSGGHGITPTRWRRQWCVLKDEHLYYYKTSFDREAGGVIDITGYNMSAAPEIKKPFAFKCEKEGGKKYFFHADNEVDREMWIKNLNLASRGERKQKETGTAQMTEAGERKGSVSALKVSSSNNRGRTSSVLAGIRFNYYDDEDQLEETRKLQHESSVADTNAERGDKGLVNGQKDDGNPSTEDDKTADKNILKIAVGVEEDADPCQVVPVKDIEGEKGTDESNKGSSEEETKCESQEKGNEDESSTKADESSTKADDTEQKEDHSTPVVESKTEAPIETPVAEEPSEVKDDEVSTSEDTSEPNVEEHKGEEVTQEVNGELSTVDVDSGTTEDNKELEGTNEDNKTVESEISAEATVDDKQPELNGQTETAEADTKSSENDTALAKDDAAKSEDGSLNAEDGSAKTEDSSAKTEDSSSKTESCTTECGDGMGKSEDGMAESEDCAAKGDNATANCEGATAKGEDATANCEGATAKAEDEAGTSEEKTKDEFQEVAESIKEAEIGLDGSERSPEALLRRLSVNSQSEIMNKVVQLRVLRQDLKDKEQSMDAINELLSSDVTPESIAEWRKKYETVTTNANSNSNDLNENSQL